MGLFNKLKNVLFEEEEIDEEVDTPSEELPEEKEVYEEVREYKPIPEHKEVVKPKEPIFEKVKTEDNDYSERELFKSETTFKFPAFDEEEFNTSVPHTSEEEHKSNNVLDYERKKREEKRNEYSRFDSGRIKEEDRKEEKKRFKPSPVISPVYGILDKDYKADDIVEATPTGVILTNKDLDVDSVRAKAFGKLKNITEEKKEKQEKPVIVQETYEIKKEEVKETKKEEKIDDVVISEEPIIDDASKLMEERTKTIDELLKSATDEVIDVDDVKEDVDNLDLTEEYRKIEDELDSVLDLTSDIKPIDEEEVIKDEKVGKHASLESDTLENDLYDLIDSMYDNTEDGE